LPAAIWRQRKDLLQIAIDHRTPDVWIQFPLFVMLFQPHKRANGQSILQDFHSPKIEVCF
jgi:hypothetical protein